MNHRFFEKNLSAYVDGELAERQLEALEGHLRECSACQRRIGELKGIRDQIRKAATASLPDNFYYSVRRALQEEEQASVIWLGTERFARNIVLGLCLIVLLMVAYTSYFDQQQVVGVDRYFNGEPADSAAHAVIGSQQELSKTDVMMAALTK